MLRHCCDCHHACGLLYIFLIKLSFTSIHLRTPLRLYFLHSLACSCALRSETTLSSPATNRLKAMTHPQAICDTVQGHATQHCAKSYNHPRNGARRWTLHTHPTHRIVRDGVGVVISPHTLAVAPLWCWTTRTAATSRKMTAAPCLSPCRERVEKAPLGQPQDPRNFLQELSITSVPR